MREFRQSFSASDKLQSKGDNPPNKRKRLREITAHPIAPTTDAASAQAFLYNLEKRRGPIFSPGGDNPIEGSTHNGEGPSRPFEHRQENELSNEDYIHLETIEKLNPLLLQHHVNRSDEQLKSVLVYRQQFKQFKDNPQQINQKTKQQALENWKALSDLSNGNFGWDQIQDTRVWNKIRAYKQLTGKTIKIDAEKTTELDQVLKSLDWQALKRVVTEEIPGHLADPKISNDKGRQNDLIQSIYYIRSMEILHKFNNDEYNNAIKREIMDFVDKAHQKDAQRTISLTFLSKVLDQENQNRVLAILQQDSLAKHSRVGLAQLQENELSTSTLEQQEGPSSSKQVENLTDPQETRAKRKRSQTQNPISLRSLQKRNHQDLVRDDASQKLDAMDQGTASSHQTIQETRQQESKEKLTKKEIEKLVTEVCGTPHFRAREFQPASKEIQSLVQKLNETGLDTQQWKYAQRILTAKGFKSKDTPYKYFYVRKASVKISRAVNRAKINKKLKEIYGNLWRYKGALARARGFRSEYDRETALAQAKGFRSVRDRRNARAQAKGFTSEYDRRNARAQAKGYNSEYQRYRK